LVVRSDEKQTAFVELHRAIHEFAVDLISQRDPAFPYRSRVRDDQQQNGQRFAAAFG